MSKVLFRRVAYWLALVCAPLAGAPTALAQSGVPAPPVRSTIDGNGVDLASGQVTASQADIHIGPSGHHGLSFSRQWVETGWRYLEIPSMSGSTNSPAVSFLGQTTTFKSVPGGYEAELQNGATLDLGLTLFRGPDGTEIEFGYSSYVSFPMDSPLGRPKKVTFPDGTVWTYHYHQDSYTVSTAPPVQPPLPSECYQNPPPGYCANLNQEYQNALNAWQAQQGTFYNSRFASITSSTGYQLKFLYDSDTPSSATAWRTLAQVKAINNAVEFCSPTGPCTLSGTWPSASYTGIGPSPFLTLATYRDAENRTTTYSYTNGKLSGIQPPGAGGNAVTYAYTSGTLGSATVAGAGTTTYSFGSTTTVTNPLSETRTLSFRADGALLWDENELTRRTEFEYCTANDAQCPVGLLKRVTAPEDNYVDFAYDSRGNRIRETHIAKPNSGLAPIVTEAHFPPTCDATNWKICNQPDWTEDARDQRTKYTYDPAHGGLLTVEAPADHEGIKPSTRIVYENRQAYYYKNSASAIVASGLNIALPVQMNACRTASSCANGADERRTAAAYGSQTGVANNLNPVSMTISRGDGTLASTSTMTYDNYGRAITADGPLAGTADSSRVRYTLSGQVEGQVSADPDGTGPAKFLATRYSYNPWGQLYLTESGTVNGFSDTDWAAFIPTNNTLVEFDTHGRPKRQKVRDGTTDYQVLDIRYDTAGRVDCTIVRMDQNSWGTLAGSCSPPQAADRVTRNVYDELNRVSQVQNGYDGVNSLATESRTFTPNGLIQTLSDGKGNTTTYGYDGHDRLQQTTFPGTYEQYGYDANGNVTSYTTRATEQLTMTYDNLNRLIIKIVPERTGDWCGLGSASLCETQSRNVYYKYDLFGNMTLAAFDGWASDDKVVNTFNTLGQLETSITKMDGIEKKLEYRYDLAGNLIRITHPDNVYFRYYRKASGAFDSAYLGDASPLFYPTRDQAGRMGTLNRWDTTANVWSQYTGFSYDGVSRLLTTSQNLAGTSYDTSTPFAYNAANQISSRSNSNDAYAFTGNISLDRSYTPNSLNQYTSVGGLSFISNANGNLTKTAGPNHLNQTVSTDFIYDPENRMIRSFAVNGTLSVIYDTKLRYDPLGRLYEIQDSSMGTRRFLYDGDALVAEYNTSGAMLRRYVHGLGGGDDPMVWFEGDDLDDRRYLYADERGSIVAVTNGAGVMTASTTDDYGINSYDEYGLPASTNVGAFQYTGQVWLPELGMYYYKARMYSPSLGRFMQTDPIGYGDGMNMYNYVGSDPVNFVDPTGLAEGWYWENGQLCMDTSVSNTAAGTTSNGTTCFPVPGGGGGGGGGGGSQIPPGPMSCVLHAPMFGLLPSECVDSLPFPKHNLAPAPADPKVKPNTCMGHVAAAATMGFIAPIDTIVSAGQEMLAAGSRTADVDRPIQSNEERARSGGRLSRDWRSAMSVGVRRYVSSLVPVPPVGRLLAGVAAGVYQFASDPTCGQNLLPPVSDLLPVGF